MKDLTCRVMTATVIAVLAVSVFASTLSLSFSASTLFVAPTGDGGGSCNTPDYNTIQDAVDNAASGDTIIVCAGSYDESVSVSTSSLVLIGRPGAILKPTTTVDSAIYVDAVDNVAIHGFEIDGSLTTVHYGIYLFNANDGIVKDNIIHDITATNSVTGVGILLFGWGQGIDNALIKSNTVYNTGRMGIFVGGMQSVSPYNWLLSSNDVILKNTVYDTWQAPNGDYGGGIQINGDLGCIINGNVVYDTHKTNPEYFYPGVYLAGTAGGTLSHNNVYGNWIGAVIWVDAPFVDFGTNTPSKPTIASSNRFHDNAYMNVWII